MNIQELLEIPIDEMSPLQQDLLSFVMFSVSVLNLIEGVAIVDGGVVADSVIYNNAVIPALTRKVLIVYASKYDAPRVYWVCHENADDDKFLFSFTIKSDGNLAEVSKTYIEATYSPEVIQAMLRNAIR